jgi:hypothetical protein
MVQVAALLADINNKVALSNRRVRRQSQRKQSVVGLWCFVTVAVAGNMAVVGWIASHAFRTTPTEMPTSLQLRSPALASASASAAAVTPTASSSSSTSLQEEIPLVVSLLTKDPSKIVITTDVRGNLGPPQVMLTNGTDWIKDRWQAASDMHGTAVKGSHWVRLDFVNDAISLQSLVLDWEAAYATDYRVQILPLLPDEKQQQQVQQKGDDNDNWQTIFDGSDPDQTSTLLTVKESGQSPGVDTKTPLHVVHSIGPLRSDKWTRSVRIWIRRSVTGWGVSLYQIQLYGHEQHQS